MAEARTPTDDMPEEGEEQSRNDKFEEQTRNIFRHFVFERLTSQIEEEANEGDMSVGEIPRPVINQILQESSQDPGTSEEKKLGKALSEMADVLNKKYHSEFVEMTKSLKLTSETAYSTFAKVASRLFQDGINWGRIVALLLFGYEIAVSVIKKEAMGIWRFLRKIVNFVVTFIIKEKIATWIRSQGGWLAILDPRENNQDIWLQRFLVGAAVAALVYFSFLKFGPKT